MEAYFRVGIFSSTHGLKGEMKVYPTTDDMHRFSLLKKVYLETEKGLVPAEVSHVRYFKNMVILKLKEFGDINEILPYKGCGILVAREDAVKLPENRYFIADLIGSEVSTDEGRRLGILTDVLQTGANDVFIVKGEKKEYLLPNIPDCILKVDVEAARILVHMMDGLEDL